MTGTSFALCGQIVRPNEYFCPNSITLYYFDRQASKVRFHLHERPDPRAWQEINLRLHSICFILVYIWLSMPTYGVNGPSSTSLQSPLLVLVFRVRFVLGTTRLSSLEIIGPESLQSSFHLPLFTSLSEHGLIQDYGKKKTSGTVYCDRMHHFDRLKYIVCLHGNIFFNKPAIATCPPSESPSESEVFFYAW